MYESPDLVNNYPKTYSCIIADDKELHRISLGAYLKKYSYIQVLGVFESPARVLDYVLHHGLPDIIFLDIDMPGMSGIELRKQLSDIPACIFITAYPEYAVESFEVEALDFLVKPLNHERFDASMERLLRYLEIRDRAQQMEHTLENEIIYIKEGHERVKLLLNDIDYLEALRDYSGVMTAGKRYFILTPMGSLLKQNPFRGFVRIHRSYAVQVKKVTRFSSREVAVGETILPVGRSYKDELGKLFSGK